MYCIVQYVLHCTVCTTLYCMYCIVQYVLLCTVCTALYSTPYSVRQGDYPVFYKVHFIYDIKYININSQTKIPQFVNPLDSPLKCNTYTLWQQTLYGQRTRR